VGFAITYPYKVRALQRETPAAEKKEKEPVYGGRVDGTEAEPAATPEAADDASERLLKHIPARALPPFLLVMSLGELNKTWHWIFFGVFALGAVALVWRDNLTLKPRVRPARWNYLFPLVAFVAWALGTSPAVRDLFGVSDELGTSLMVAVAFLIGIVDDLVLQFLDPQPATS
jgi:hypothetical protein